jgi:hypothetical protein
MELLLMYIEEDVETKDDEEENVESVADEEKDIHI